MPHLFRPVNTRPKRDDQYDSTMFDYYLLLQDDLSPMEFLRATLLIEKILSINSLTNLTDDEIHLLTKIIRVTL